MSRGLHWDTVPEHLRHRLVESATSPAKLSEKKVAAPAPAPAPQLNKTEAAYARRLDLRIAAGELVRYQFCALTLVIFEALPRKGAKRTRYTPDFFVVSNTSHRLELHEVKGPYIREDALLKLQAAAKQFPEFRFWLCQLKGGQWTDLPILPK